MTRRRDRMFVLGAIGAIALAACSSEPVDDVTVSLDSLVAEAAPPPDLEPELIRVGEALYAQHCASCHGVELAGESDWRIPNDDRSLKPPPHNATGHTWHHSDRLLLETVRDGIDTPVSRMPVFARVLTDDDIEAILEFIKSNWGPQERLFQWEITWQEKQRG
jgi:mono/diheme cytochrome c family protein